MLGFGDDGNLTSHCESLTEGTVEGTAGKLSKIRQSTV